MRKRPAQALDAVKQSRRLLAQWLDGGSDPRQPVAEILRLTEAIEDELRAPKGSGVARNTQSSHGVHRYSVDKTPASAVLTEHRPDGASQPFRVSKSFYDALAQVMPRAEDRPL